MLRILLSLFLTGIVLGYGPCLLSCGPLLVSYIVATKDNAGGGFRVYAIFSLTRIVVYLIFGLLAGLFGEHIIHEFFESELLNVFFGLFGVFLVVIGLLFILEKGKLAGTCKALIGDRLGASDAKNIIVFGLIVSFAPCLPLLAVLGYIALISDHWLKGLLYMGAFGLGTVISPMIPLSLCAGWAAKISKRNQGAVWVLKIACGLVIAYLGLRLLLVVWPSLFGVSS